MDNVDFPDRYAAIVWICQNQLGKRNLTQAQKDVLIAQEYDAQKKTAGGDRGTERDDSGKFTASGEIRHLPHKNPKTRTVVAKAHGITENAVKSAVEFSHGLDAADEVAPGFKNSVMSGTIKAPKSVIASLPKLEEPERKKAVQAIQNSSGKNQYSEGGGENHHQAKNKNPARAALSAAWMSGFDKFSAAILFAVFLL